jgi:predicted DNA-binding protein
MKTHEILGNPEYLKAIEGVTNLIFDDLVKVLLKYQSSNGYFKEFKLSAKDRFSLIFSAHMSALATALITAMGGGTKEDKANMAKKIIYELERAFLSSEEEDAEDYSEAYRILEDIRSGKDNVVSLQEVKDRLND